MSRTTIAAVVAGLYVAILAWVVNTEGKAYRETLRRERERARSSTAAAVGPSAGTIAPREKTSRAVEPTPPVASTAEAAPATPLAPTSSPAAREPATTSGPPQQAERDPGFVWADSLDLAHLSLDDERHLGRELHRLVLTANRRMETGSYDQRVEQVARGVLEHRSRKDVEYTFTVLDSDAVSAFSHPGGYVYVCRGLFDMFGEDENYVLEFVVGHEVAHVDLNHAVKFLEGGNADEKKRGVGTLLQFYLLIAFGYPEAQEFEADAWIFKRMSQEGRTRREQLAFLRKFRKYAEEHGFASGGKLPDLEKTDASAVENHFRAHPAAWKRLARLESLSGSATSPAPASAGPRP